MKEGWEHKGDGDTNWSWRTWNSPQRFGKGAEGIENHKKDLDHTAHSIKIGKNTRKSLGDLRRFGVTQTSVKYPPHLTLVLKTRKVWNNLFSCFLIYKNALKIIHIHALLQKSVSPNHFIVHCHWDTYIFRISFEKRKLDKL